MNYGLLEHRLLSKGFSARNMDIVSNEDGTFDVYFIENAYDANFIVIVNSKYEIIKVIRIR